MRQVLKEVLLPCLPPSLFFAENQLSCWAISDLLRAIWGLPVPPWAEVKVVEDLLVLCLLCPCPPPLSHRLLHFSSLALLLAPASLLLPCPPASFPFPGLGFKVCLSCTAPPPGISLVHSLLSFKLSLHHLHEDFPHHQHSIATPNPCFFWLFFLGIFSSLHPVHWFAWCPSFPTRGFVCFVNC